MTPVNGEHVHRVFPHVSNRWLEIMFLAIALIGLVALVALVVAGLGVIFRSTTPTVEPGPVLVSTPPPDQQRR
ncbi:hypothetical protein GT755_07090 [Herbidospora sp. NEAU-GS84]|uniref:Uncharacterized protein n=1 Tax=Herbidospora solisilvae TaxID=2696284 RepID=A0A7C9MVK5_9ACTN|nr:hypothetical protein [Herbidospora solisilvae]NAS21451.1 hypothetical protein [Herbidospora solisilvae]